MTTEVKKDHNMYSAVSENLRTLPREDAQVISLADYERRFNVQLGDKGRRNLATIKSNMRKSADKIQRPPKAGPVPRMEPNLILCAIPVGDMAPEVLLHMKRLLPGVLETAMRKLGAKVPPLKVVQVEEEGQESSLEVRSK